MPRTKQTAKKSTGERAPFLQLPLDPSVVAFPVPDADEQPVKVKRTKNATDVRDLVPFPPSSRLFFTDFRLY